MSGNGRIILRSEGEADDDYERSHFLERFLKFQHGPVSTRILPRDTVRANVQEDRHFPRYNEEGSNGE